MFKRYAWLGSATLTILVLLSAHVALASPDHEHPDTKSEQSAAREKKEAPAAANDDSQTGSSPHFAGMDKSGKPWSDLPRPDASWETLKDQKDRKPVWNLTQEEQDKILHSRAKTPTMMGSFYECNNLLYCCGEPFIMTTSVEVSRTRLQTVHVKDYHPMQAELFESMARQTKSTLRYDPTFLSRWISAPPAMSLPYSLNIADDWKCEDRGLYVAYSPKVQPVGMDIYILGRYSGLSPEETRQARNTNAMNFARMLDKSANIEAMKELKVDGCDAIYFETKAPGRPDCQWRQWSLIKNGEAFVIVSSIDGKNATKLVPEVQAMVASFHVAETPPVSPGL